jgi:hypothetical protein
LTPELLLTWSASITFSGLAICLLALGIRGTVLLLKAQDKENKKIKYEPGTRSVKVPPPPVPPPKIE